MIGWSPWERRSLALILETMLPSPGQGVPGLGDLDLTEFWERFEERAPPVLRIGLRGATWGLGLGALVFLGRPARFDALSPADRELLLERAAGSSVFAIRQMVMVVKVVASLAYFHDPAIQAWIRREATS